MSDNVITFTVGNKSASVTLFIMECLSVEFELNVVSKEK